MFSTSTTNIPGQATIFSHLSYCTNLALIYLLWESSQIHLLHQCYNDISEIQIWPCHLLTEKPSMPISFSWSLPYYGSLFPLLFHLMPLYKPCFPSSFNSHIYFVSSLNVSFMILLLDLCSLFTSMFYKNWANLYPSLIDYHTIHLLCTHLESPEMELMLPLRALIKLNAQTHHTTF